MDFKAISHAAVIKHSGSGESNEYILNTVRESVEAFASELFRILNSRSSSLERENEQLRNSADADAERIANRLTAEKNAEVARIKSERDAVVARLTDEVARYALELQKKKDEYEGCIAQINDEFAKVVEEANKYIKSNNALLETNANIMAQLAHLKSVTPLSYEERIDLAQFRSEAALWKSLAEKKDMEIETLKKTIASLRYDIYILKQTA